MSTAKSIVSDMIEDRLDGDNYDSRHRKIKYHLNENDSLEFITRERLFPRVKPMLPKKNGIQMRSRKIAELDI